MNATIHVASILAVVLSATGASAQGFSWNQLTLIGSPGPRFSNAMAYDGARQLLVLFGGWNGSYLGDTWEWNGGTWTQSTPPSGPSGRHDHAMVYDSVRHRVVLFGGWGGTSFGDTWEWDGATWFARFSPNYPGARHAHAMAYDATRQRVVLFGGTLNGSILFGDTWEWDGTNWLQRTSPSSPSTRFAHAMAYDVASHRVVLFGGTVGGTGSHLSDTWEWDGVAWVQRLSASSPMGRSDHAMAYDEVRHSVVAFGGFGGSALNDTWEWDGNNWTQLAPTSSPTVRFGHAMAYDEGLQRVVLFGGLRTSSYLDDTWMLDTPGTSAFATAYGSSCGSPALGLDPTARPLLGQIGRATITNAPTNVAGVAIGWNNQFFGPFALPVTLASIGMAGCELLHSAEIIGLGVTPLTASTLSFSLAIPNIPNLIGAHVFLQAYAFAPGQNALHIIASNGIDWRLGDI